MGKGTPDLERDPYLGVYLSFALLFSYLLFGT